MSNEAVGDGTSDGGSAHGALGVLATWRQTPGQVRALLAGVMISKLAGFLQLFLLWSLTRWGFTSAQAGLALGVWGAGMVAGTFIGGWLSDHLSARTVIIISMLGSTGPMISIPYVRLFPHPYAYPLLLLAVLLVSTVGQLYRPASQALMAELTPSAQQVMVTAMYMLCFNVGIVVAPQIGAALASVSYYLLFWTEGLALLTFGLIAVLALPRGAKAGAVPVRPTPTARKRTQGGYLAVLADRRYLTFLGAFLLISVVYCQYTAAVPLAIKHTGLSIWWYSAILSINGIICATCQLPSTRFVQNWPLRLVQLLGFGLLAVGYGLYAIAIVPVVLIIGTLTWTAADLIGVPTMFAYPGMVAPAGLRGRYFAAMQGTHGLGLAVGPILGVALYDNLGQRAWLWLAGAALLATVIGQAGLRRPTAVPGTEPAPELADAAPVG
jgi:MFS family permease